MRDAEAIKADLAASLVRTLTRKELLAYRAAKCGLIIRTYSPGDGVTRYRFFTNPANSYFGPDNGIATVLGFKAADTFVTGYYAGKGML